MRALALCGVLFSACPATPKAVDAGAALPTQAGLPSTDVTAAALDGWMRYAAFVVTQSAERRPDGGAPGHQQLLSRALADQEARADAGLSEAAVDRIENLVAEFVALRGTVKLTGADALAEFEKYVAGLPFDQRKRAEAALAEMKTQQRVPLSLGPLEARYGKPAVDAVLAREAEVTKAWEALMNSTGAHAR